MKRRVCVIGAGISGVATAKILKEHGIPFDCYEKGSQIGGNWRYMNDNGISACYKSLHINTAKCLSYYPDFPMPDDYPDYPRHDLMISYLENYAEHFGVYPYIRFNTEIVSVKPLDGQWKVTLHNGEEKDYSSVIVANGHHWDPYFPKFRGEFNGNIIHAHDYRVPSPFENQRVLIIGIGNSAVDIASEVCTYAKKTILSTRSGAHIVPKYIFGKPAPNYSSPLSEKLNSWPLFGLLFDVMLWLARGSLKSYGLPKPKHKLREAHGTISSDIFTQLGRGNIKIKPDIERFENDKVYFTDDSVEVFDTIIFTTGYKISFPFLTEKIMPVKDNKVDLYCGVVHPKHNNLFFVGLVQPLTGSILPLAHWQAKWIAKLINGDVILPNETEMRYQIDAYHKSTSKRYKKSLRHTIEVEHYRYQNLLKKLIKER